MASERDLRALAAIVSEARSDLPDGEGLPPSLLADLMAQIRCDALGLDGWDTGRQACWFSQEIPHFSDAIGSQALDPVFWANYWNCQPSSYPARTGDLRSVLTNIRGDCAHPVRAENPVHSSDLQSVVPAAWP